MEGYKVGPSVALIYENDVIWTGLKQLRRGRDGGHKHRNHGYGVAKCGARYAPFVVGQVSPPKHDDYLLRHSVRTSDNVKSAL